MAASESQAPQSGPVASAPAFVRLDGAVLTATGEARTGSVVVVVSLYAGQDDTAPLWSETQAATLDAAGRYTIFAGATQAEGMPREFFTSNTAQWIGVAVQGEPEQPRVRMVSVPYALSAGNADTLAGRTTDDFVLAEKLTDSVKSALKAEGVAAADAGTDPGILGTSGRIAKFNASGLAADIVDSVITESGGNIGIGIIAPTEVIHLNHATRPGVRFHLAGAFRGFFGVDNSAYYTTAPSGDFIVAAGGNIRMGSAASTGEKFFINNTSGNVGVGTLVPSELFHLNAANGARSFVRFSEGGTFRGGFGVENGANYLVGTVDNDMVIVAATNLALGAGGGGAAKLYVNSAGNVGIGTALPTVKLQVAGDVLVSGNIGAKYQDVAEWVETGEPIEAGTVVIVAPGESDEVVASTKAYDTRVAGAVSRQPGLILGERGDSKSLIAQSGRVIIKVDASYGAIKPGDLLVTSPTPGYAMRSKPIKVGGGQVIHRPGTLLGKALEALPNGKGEILVLLTLQ